MARNDSGDKMYNDLQKTGEYRSEKRIQQDKEQYHKKMEIEKSEMTKRRLFGSTDSPFILNKILGSTTGQKK